MLAIDDREMGGAVLPASMITEIFFPGALAVCALGAETDAAPARINAKSLLGIPPSPRNQTGISHTTCLEQSIIHPSALQCVYFARNAHECPMRRRSLDRFAPISLEDRMIG